MTTYLNTSVFVDLAPMSCPVASCGVHYALDRVYRDKRREDGKLWHCPNGHTLSFREAVKSDTQKLREAETREVALRDQLQASVLEAEMVRVALLRDRQRFANGVCPCCNRAFDNVRRHMTTKHPDYDVTKVHQPSAGRFACSCGRAFSSMHGLRIHQGSQRRDDWAESETPSWRAHLTKV